MADIDLIICRCREVTRREIIEAIDDGATDVDGVKRRVGACMGLCQGKTCERLVAGIIAERTGQNPADIKPQRSRVPVRPIHIAIASLSDHGEGSSDRRARINEGEGSSDAGARPDASENTAARGGHRD